METRKRLLSRHTVVEFAVHAPLRLCVVPVASLENGESPLPFVAFTRNVAVVFGWKPLTFTATVFAGIVGLSGTKFKPTFCSTTKPVSLEELSFHVRRITDGDVPLAARFDGAAGPEPLTDSV